MAGIVARAGLTAAARADRPVHRRHDGGRRSVARLRDTGPLVRPLVLVILDGFGIGDGAGHGRDRGGADAGLAIAPRALAALASSARPRAPSGCRPARWGTPRSAISISAPDGRSCRTCRGSTPRSRMARSSSARRSWPPANRRRRRPAGCRSSGSSGRAASTPTTGTSSRSSSLPLGRGARRCASMPSSTAATRHRVRRWGTSATSRRASAGLIRTPGSPRSGAATSRWTGTSRWERVEIGYDAIVHGIGVEAPSAEAAIAAAYERGESDEFVRPTVIDGVDGGVRSGESIIHVNFRADRARQLTHALADRAFSAFDRARRMAGRRRPTSGSPR